MAKQKVRDGTPSQSATADEILLILDQAQKKLSALKAVAPDGKAQTIPATEENQSQFLKVDKHSSILENFLKNFWQQVKNPTAFTLLRMTVNDYRQNKQALKDLTVGKQTPAVGEFLRKYAIVPREQFNQTNQILKDMAKQAATPPTQAQPAEGPRYRFQDEMINWPELAKMGISRDYLQQKGLLDQMLKGYKTSELVPITMTVGYAVIRTDARLSFQTMRDSQQVGVAVNGVKREPELNRAYFGYAFSPEDKKNLLETGNMGRAVEIRGADGEMHPTLISIDRLTNDIASMRAESLYIPQEFMGVKLTEQEVADLRDGKAVFIEGMVGKSGKEFDATVQANADRRGLELIFPKGERNMQSIGGVDLSPGQIEDLSAGKAIFVEGMKRKNSDDLFDSFINRDEATGQLNFWRFNPDSPEGARELVIPKVLGGVSVSPEDRQELREGKPVFIENMVRQDGTQYSSFVKLDTNTGDVLYSKSRDFEQRAEVRVPAEVYGKTLSATDRANLQDGKVVHLTGLKVPGQPEFSTFAKMNPGNNRLEFYKENPDIRRDNSQRTVQAETPAQTQGQNRKQKNGPQI